MEQQEKFIITINREAGAGGTAIGEIVAKKLGIKFYDKVVAEGLTEYFNLEIEEIERLKLERSSWLQRAAETLQSYSKLYGVANDYLAPTPENFFNVEAKIVNNIAKQESCVMCGRLMHHFLRLNKRALRVFIIANRDYRKRTIMAKQGVDEKEAGRIIDQLDSSREKYTKEFTGLSRSDVHNYDLVLNVVNLTDEQAADMIIDFGKANKLF